MKGRLPRDEDQLSEETFTERSQTLPLSNLQRRTLLSFISSAAALGATGVSVAQNGGGDGGSKKWSFPTGGAVQTSPTVVDNTVYVGSDDNNVYAIDADNGTEQWQFNTGGQIYSSPTVTSSTVYIASETGNIFAINADDGTEKWKFETENDINSSPTVSAGTVYIGTGDENVYALSTSDGEEQWETPFSTDGVVDSSPTVVDGSVYVGSSDNNVYAIDAAEGTEQWTISTEGSIISSPTVADGTVYVGSYDGNLYAISDGSAEWKTNLGSAVYTSPTVVGESVYAGDYSFGTLFELDTETGDKTPIAPDEMSDPLMSSPTVANGIVYIGDGDGIIYGFDPEAKSQDQITQWTFETGDMIESSPTVTDGTVYVGSDDGNVYAISAGASGSSSDSRVSLGTLGHHHVFVENSKSDSDAKLSTTPSTIQYGAHIANQDQRPTQEITVTNQSETEISLTADIPEEVNFVEDSWLSFLHSPDKPPVSVAPGETAAFTIELNTAAAFERFGSGAELSIEFYTDGQRSTEIPIEATLFNDPVVLEKLAENAAATRDMFVAKEVLNDAFQNLENAYIDLFETTKELGIGRPDYIDALDNVKALVDEILKLGDKSAIARAFDEPAVGPGGGTPEEFQENYLEGYDTVVNKLQDAEDALREPKDAKAAGEAFQRAKSTAAQLAADWHGSQEKINRRAFKQALPLLESGKVANEYGAAVDEVDNAISLTTPLIVLTASPVKTAVIAPDGREVSSEQTEIPDASYQRLNLPEADSSKELIVLEDPQPRDYTIKIDPEADAQPNDTYSVGVRINGETTQIAEKEQIEEIPTDGHTVSPSSPVSDDSSNSDEPSVIDYTGDSSIVETPGLLNAISDWRDDEINTTLLLDVIEAWRSGDQVT